MKPGEELRLLKQLRLEYTVRAARHKFKGRGAIKVLMGADKHLQLGHYNHRGHYVYMETGDRRREGEKFYSIDRRARERAGGRSGEVLFRVRRLEGEQRVVSIMFTEDIVFREPSYEGGALYTNLMKASRHFELPPNPLFGDSPERIEGLLLGERKVVPVKIAVNNVKRGKVAETGARVILNWLAHYWKEEAGRHIKFWDNKPFEE